MSRGGPWKIQHFHYGLSNERLPAFIRPTGSLFSKKYGVDLIRYPHGDTATVVYSSNKLDGSNSLQLSGVRSIPNETCKKLNPCVCVL